VTGGPLWLMGEKLIRVLRRLARPLGVAFVILAALYHVWSLGAPLPVLERVEALLYDVRFRVTLDPPPPTHKIVIIDIDERSLAAEGRWPWSREHIGTMLSGAFDAGAEIVGFDVTFAEPERNPVDALLADPDVVARAGNILTAERAKFDADARFAEHVARGKTVLGMFLHNDGEGGIGVLPEPLAELQPDMAEQLSLPRTVAHTGNRQVIQDKALDAGSLTTQPDGDGVVRRSPLIYLHNGNLYGSLSLVMAANYLEEPIIIEAPVDIGGELVIPSISIGDRRIPIDKNGRAVVPYRGGAFSFTYVSATDVIHNKLPPDALKGALAMVGTSALGLKDMRSTPLETNYPGVEVHANLLDGILGSVEPESRFWHRPEYEVAVTFVLILLFGIAIVIVQPRLAAGGQIVFSVVTIGGVIGLNYWLWMSAQMDFPLSPPLVVVVFLNAFYMMLGFLEETQRRAQIHNMFGQYVAPAHIDRLLDNPAQASFDGESKEMTVLFSDVRSFTTISEKLTAQGLKQLLNRYFTPITKIIFDNHGTIDKYVGDMVMAFWGAPLDDPKHALHAVDSALEMLKKVDDLKEEFGAEGLPRIDVGIGINTGPMNVGDMGSSYRRAYTVLGDAVNLGSRLESATKMYGLRLLIGETTAAIVPEYLLRHIDRLQVKGKTEPVKVYEPLCRKEQATPEIQANLDIWHKALDGYFTQQWDAAEQGLKELIRREPDCKLYKIYLERVQHMREEPPGESWDGAYIAKEK
jgi:adenylate cyclase